MENIVTRSKINNFLNPSIILILLTLLAVVTGSFREPIYHDELLNFSKANDDNFNVFNYAIRPLFYAINYLSAAVIGKGFESQYFSSAIIFILTILILLQISRKLGMSTPELPAIILCSSNIFIANSFRGMPHPLATLFILGTIFFALSLKDEASKKNAFFLGLFVMFCLATHPTTIPALVMIALFIIFSTTRVGIIYSILSTLLFFAFYNYLYFIFYGTTWVQILLGGLKKVADPVYTYYHKGFTFYFEEVFKDFYYVLIVLAGILLSRIRSVVRSWSWHFLKPSRKFTVLFLATMGSLAILSVSEWKFTRVLSSYSFLIALCIGIFVDNLTKDKLTNKIIALSILFALGTGSILKSINLNATQSYSDLYNVIKHLSPQKVVVVSDASMWQKTYNLRGLLLDKQFAHLNESYIANDDIKILMIHKKGLSELRRISESNFAFDAPKIYSWRKTWDLYVSQKPISLARIPSVRDH